MDCIGVDVSKQGLSVYDGEVQRTFPNETGLNGFATFIADKGEVAVVYEPTSTYSRRLEAFCERKGIPCFAVNPRIIPHLREVMGN